MTRSSLFPFSRFNRDFVSLLYPRLCIACGRDVPPYESCFCYPCKLKVQATNMHLQTENEFIERLWGRVYIKAAASMYYFVKKTPIQYAIHQLKYKNKPDIGVKLGREYGAVLRRSSLFDAVDLIVPVPLHPQKERQRGYNQSEAFADGLSETMKIPVANKVLARTVSGESQTRKSRIERHENAESAYSLHNISQIKGKNILLVDDVLTSGATLETCGNLLQKASGASLFLATIAIALKK